MVPLRAGEELLARAIRGKRPDREVLFVVDLRGGQTPLHVRLPKFGFSNRRFKEVYEIVNLERLEKLEEGDICPQVFEGYGG